MFNFKRAKTKAIKNLKRHYVIFVISCLLAAYLGSAYGSTLSAYQYTIGGNDDIVESGKSVSGKLTADSVFNKLTEGQAFDGKIISDSLLRKEEGSGAKYGILEIGRSKGVLSSIVNGLNSGQFLIIAFNTINSVVHSNSVSGTIMIIISSALMMAITIFLKDTYAVTLRRIFMEGRVYDRIGSSTFIYLLKTKKLIKASTTIFVTGVFQFLWNFTIIGGAVKRYSYAMVPYIVAENPDIAPLDAIALSRRMMYGHKWECFRFDLSLIGLDMLSVFTLGLSGILFANPYREVIMVEFYAYVRGQIRRKGGSYANMLNDKYLYEKADHSLLEKTYSDVIDIMNDDIDVRDLRHNGFRGFIENNLGIIYGYDKFEDEYNVAIEQEEKISEYRAIMNADQYPGRLSPVPEEMTNKRVEDVHYLRHYSIWSIVGIFFTCCFIGWSWEVMLHLVRDGVFVNRGFFHGPWLPIYGSGGIMILILLFRFRNRPFLEGLTTIALCGVVEYATSWYLEVTQGAKWWDYTGYFLNLNGRICAEGLLVFMLGGIAIVYVLAPMLDNCFRKVNKKIFIPICCVLLLIFGIDAVYSTKHPNMGEGITDYDDTVFVDVKDSR